MIHQKFIATLLVGLCAFSVNAQRKITNGAALPAFSIQDVNGTILTQDSLKGNKVLFSFTRNAGCPVCNSYVHQLLEKTDSFNQLGVKVFIVSQSSRQSLLTYLQNEKLPFRFIPDTSDYLYNLFAIEKSKGKSFKSAFHGGLRMRKQGMKNYTGKPKFEGNRFVIGADFIIDSEGIVRYAHYGTFLGDRLDVSVILQWFQNLR